ncbi:MAG: hypothetical protein AAFN79_12420 [Pseudomonadota bacterium]
MNDEPDSIVLRYLRRLDERTERMEGAMKDIAAELRIMKGHMAGFMQSEQLQDGAMAEFADRLERVEKRLDITEA